MKRTLWMLLVIFPSPATAQQDLLNSEDRWTMSASSSFAMEEGQPVLHVVGGASLNDIEFTDGTISFDVKLTDRAGFVGIQFRAEERSAEHVYLRPHRSNEWDAVQYQPIMNGSSTWQLHRGDGFTAPATLPNGEWLHIRLVVQAGKAELFVGDGPHPTMSIGLEHGITSGAIGFTAGFRGEAPEGAIPGSFRRLTIDTSSAQTMADRPRPATANDDTTLRTWRVSAPFEVTSLPVTMIPENNNWTSVSAEPRGLVNLNRYHSRIAGAERTAVIARTTIQSSAPTTVPLHLDFSDDVSVFLNGELLFSGTNTWESRYPYYLGALDPDILTNQIWLHLREGDNDLTLVVSELAFGWGFVAKIAANANVHLSPR